MYATALEQPEAHTFLARVAFYNYNTYSTDTTNVFAEVPNPSAALFINVNWRYI